LDSKETKDRLKIEEYERLKQWFSSVEDWNEGDVCQTRRLWLELVGLPIQIWSEENIKKIAETWGDVVLVEKESSKLESFASAKVIIDTLCMKPIEDEVIIQVKDIGFTVSVFEAKTEYTIFHSGPLDGVSLDPADTLDSGNNSGGDLEDQLHMDRDNRQVLGNNGDVQGGNVEEIARASRCDLNLNLNLNSSHLEDQHRDCHNEAFKAIVMAGSNQEVSEEGLNVAKVLGVVEKSPLLSLNADVEGASGLLEDRLTSRNVVSASSSSRTKTAQLSGNDYYMELEKLNPSRLHQLRLK